MTGSDLEFVMMKLLSKKDVRALVLYSPQHIDRLEAEGRFPKRVKLSDYRGGRCGWIESEVLAWLEERISKRSIQE